MQSVYYNNLGANKRIYDAALQCFQNRGRSFPVTGSIPAAELAIEVLNDHPEIFYVGQEFRVMSSLMRRDIMPVYLYSPAESVKIRNQLDATAQTIISEHINDHQSDYDKVRSLHDYLKSNLEYDTVAATSHRPNERNIAEAHNIIGALLKNNRYRTEFYDPLYRHRTCVRGSDAGDVDPLIYSLIFQRKGGLFKKAMNDAVSLTFFDTAGENLNSLASMQTFNRYLYHSSGIILLLDPLQLPAVRDELQGKIRLPEENTDVNTILNRTIEIVRTGSGLTNLSKKIDIPIAIAFTKIDAVDELLDPASCLKNDSAHIRKGAFDKIDFEDANNEMQSLVESWLGMELYQTVSTQFSNFAFFGLSALGSNPDMDNKIPKFRPFRVADPFLWILSQEHIIPTE